MAFSSSAGAKVEMGLDFCIISLMGLLRMLSSERARGFEMGWLFVVRTSI